MNQTSWTSIHHLLRICPVKWKWKVYFAVRLLFSNWKWRGSWNSPNPNQFMHQKVFDTGHINIVNILILGNGVGRLSNIIQTAFLMHKLIRIHGVFFTHEMMYFVGETIFYVPQSYLSSPKKPLIRGNFIRWCWAGCHDGMSGYLKKKSEWSRPTWIYQKCS